jgi:hypothetical protein
MDETLKVRSWSRGGAITENRIILQVPTVTFEEEEINWL